MSARHELHLRNDLHLNVAPADASQGLIQFLEYNPMIRGSGKHWKRFTLLRFVGNK